MTLIIDGDWLVYVACCASENDIRWDEWIHTLHADPVDIRDMITGRINQWKEKTGDSDVMLCFSSYPTFRHDIYPDYKANRMGKRKPLGLRDATDWAKAEYQHHVMEGLEADDVMGLLLTGSTLPNPILVSIDKDMRTVPGRLLVEDELVLTSKHEANVNWMTQALTGDSTDNYPGLKGFGPKTAAKLLDGAESLAAMWDRVVGAYKKNGQTFGDALLNARLARILRHGDYDYINREVKLWEPDTDPEIRANG